MGITIHYEGTLKKPGDIEKVIDTIKEFAAQNNMPYSLFSEENVLLERIKDEKNRDYQSPTKGIVIEPHLNTDALRFEFDENGFIQDFCKTQFADIEAHVKIIELFKSIEHFFDNLNITDEGEYWNTGDRELLNELLDKMFCAIAAARQSNPKLKGPVRIQGRIIDLME